MYILIKNNTLQIDASKLRPFFAFKEPEFSKRGSKHAESEVMDRNNWQFQEVASFIEILVSIFQCLSIGSKRPYLKLELYYELKF